MKHLIESFLNHVNTNKDLMAHNEILFNIFEGELLNYIVDDLKEQFQGKSFDFVKQRICPINVLQKIIDKLSKVYHMPPIRELTNDAKNKDEELLSFYCDNMKINQKLNIANEFYNLHKACLIEPYVNRGLPRLRVIPFDRFLPYSDDMIEPNIPTHVVIFEGKNSEGTNIYRAYSDKEFIYFDSEGRILEDLMIKLGNPHGENIFGRLPFIYANMSNNLLIPKADTDTLKLTKIIPILLSDLNYAVMFSAFSILYGINVKSKSLQMAPNAFWELESDNSSEHKPQLGQLKPQVEIDGVLRLVQAEFSFWLDTKGIKPGNIGRTQGENFASGISKMLDESDTTETRNRQVEKFTDIEEDLWDLIINYMHPVFSKEGLIDTMLDWTPSVAVKTSFAEQVPLYNRGELIDSLIKEMEAGFISRRMAIKKLYPNYSDKEIEEHILEIDSEEKVEEDGVHEVAEDQRDDSGLGESE